METIKMEKIEGMKEIFNSAVEGIKKTAEFRKGMVDIGTSEKKFSKRIKILSNDEAFDFYEIKSNFLYVYEKRGFFYEVHGLRKLMKMYIGSDNHFCDGLKFEIVNLAIA